MRSVDPSGSLTPSERTFGESQMNVRLSPGANRCVLWQRNADWSRRRAAPTNVARIDRKSAIRRVGWIRRCLGLRPLLPALRRSKWPMPGRVDASGRPRRDLGGGAAWHQPEHEALGIPFPPIKERAERLEEGVQVIRLLMTKDRASFAGRHYQLRKASYHPRPIQRPHPPIWIGAGGEQLMLPIVARQADAWHAFGSE